MFVCVHVYSQTVLKSNHKNVNPDSQTSMQIYNIMTMLPQASLDKFIVILPLLILNE